MSVYIQDQIIPHPHAASCPDAAFVSSGSGSECTVPAPQSWTTPLLRLFGTISRQSPQSIESLQRLQEPSASHLPGRDSVLGWRCPRGSCRTPGQGKGPVAHTLGLGPSEISKRLHNLGDNGPATSLALKAPFKWKVSSSLLRCPPILSFLSLHLRGPVVLGGAEGRWVKGCTTHTPSSWSRHLALVLRTLMSEQVRSSPGFSSFRRQ